MYLVTQEDTLEKVDSGHMSFERFFQFQTDSDIVVSTQYNLSHEGNFLFFSGVENVI